MARPRPSWLLAVQAAFGAGDAEQVADAVVACAIDRRRERAMPRSTLLLAKLSRAFPALQELLRPMLEAKGARVKARLKAQRRGAKPG